MILVELAAVEGASLSNTAKKFILAGDLHLFWKLIKYSHFCLNYQFGERKKRNTCCQVTIVTGHMKSSFISRLF